MQSSSIDGIYTGYFTGLAGVSLGIFVFQDGIVTGADAGEATYDGEYTLTDDAEFFVGTIQFTIPPGISSITGATADSIPVTFEVPFKLPVLIDHDEIFRIETQTGPVNAKFRKLRNL